MPRWVHSYLVDPRTIENPQNTDPFVFGGFAYTNCRQDYWSKRRQARRLTVMAHLAVGSMILFGSTRKGTVRAGYVFRRGQRRRNGS